MKHSLYSSCHKGHLQNYYLHYDTVGAFDFIDFGIIPSFSCPLTDTKMRSKTNSADSKTKSSVSIFIVVGLCCFLYILGAWQKSGFGNGDSIALEVNKLTDCGTLSTLNFETHHN